MQPCDECAALRAKLKEAEDAWHALNIGGGITQVKYGEKMLSYGPQTLANLARYVATLRNELAVCMGQPRQSGRRAILMIPT